MSIKSLAPNRTKCNNTAQMSNGVKLVRGEQLLKILFEANSRPSKYWLRDHTRNKTIPHIRVGKKIFYDPDKVRAHIDKYHNVKAR